MPLIQTKECFDHSDYCHCSDWENDTCPDKCFRARLTKDLREMDPPYEYPVSFANFKSSGYCPLNDGKEENSAETK